jgi:uncharacterized membrane protein
VAADWFRWLAIALMVPALVLLVASMTVRNPTLVGMEGAGPPEARGMLRITRHPMLVAIATWAALHLLAAGDLASIILFGAFLVTTLAGMPSLDAKMERRDAEQWRPFAGTTSIVPFLAIAEGRNRLQLAEIGWVAPIGGGVLWALLLALHGPLFGVSPIP